MLVLTLLLAFASVSLLAFGILSTVFGEERHVSRRLAELGTYEAAEVMAATPLLQPFSRRVLRPAGSAVVGLARKLVPKEYREDVRRRLVLAGLQGTWTPDRYVAVKLLAVGAAVAAVVALTISGVLTGGLTIILGCALIGLGLFGPDAVLGARISSRQHTMVRQLPEMIDMLTISIEAGLGFDQALVKLVRNASGPLAEEFGRMLQETQAGVSRRDALRHLAERTDVGELNSFVMALVQADVFGVSVSNVLRVQSNEMRIRRRQRAEQLAQRAPVKMVFPLIICILPATMLVVAGPAVVAILKMFSMIGGR